VLKWTKNFCQNDAVCISLITDGLEKHNKLVGIVYKDYYLSGVIYVEGGDLAIAERYSGIDRHKCMERAVPIECVKNILSSIIRNKKLVITYNKDFVTQFLRQVPYLDLEKDLPPMLDIGELYTYMDRKKDPEAISNFETLSEMCDFVTKSVKRCRKLTFSHLVDQYCRGGNDLPRFKYVSESLFCLYDHIFHVKEE
jgi:hypothetical protein